MTDFYKHIFQFAHTIEHLRGFLPHGAVYGKILQPEAFGKISFASSFSGCFVMLANLGMPIYAMAPARKKETTEKN